MNTLIDPVVTQTFHPGEKVHSFDLIAALDFYASKIKVLSLDCFDTILWRKSATPTDLFYDMQNQPTFKSVGINTFIRVNAEANLRKLKLIQEGKSEVTLDEIYRYNFPSLTQEQLAALTNEELDVEIGSCYAFPPIVELIRKAHARQIKIIIVSDTYLKQEQLKNLLSHSVPADALAMIDKIYCSCDYGKSKPDGIFNDILSELNIPAQSILHIGDNPVADFLAPRESKINALHLVHHDQAINDLMRLETVMASFMDSSIRHTRSHNNPFRGVLAATKIATDKPEKMIGHTAIGPIMYSFAKFICDEIDELKQSGKSIKVAFLMRDAYLPSLACKAIKGEEVGDRIRISRFSAWASSFRTKDDVSRYLIDVISSNRFSDITAQLLIPKPMANEIIKSAKKHKHTAIRFIQLIQRKRVLQIIFQKSAEYRQRLKKYLENQMGLKKGDTLVFVDLGYSGTAQRVLEPVFREEFGIDIIGRYLISLGVPGWNSSRKGLLDHSWCDDRTMLTLVAYIPLLEQICTCSEKSTVGYDEDGNPLFNDTTFSDEQYTKLDLLHLECINFIKKAEEFCKAANIKIPLQMLRDITTAELARMIFLPTEDEINYFKSFEFDLNLGTKDMFNILDIERGLTGLRRRGLFNIFMEKNSKTFRTNSPAEMRSAGIELSLALMAQHRFMLELVPKDTSLRRNNINIIISRGRESTQTSMEAQLTHDGYFALHLPLGTGDFQIGILFGQEYQWIEIESAEIVSINAFQSSADSHYAKDCSSELLYGTMINRGGKLFECQTKASFAMIAPKLETNANQNYVLRVVFRPITRWTETTNNNVVV